MPYKYLRSINPTPVPNTCSHFYSLLFIISVVCTYIQSMNSYSTNPFLDCDGLPSSGTFNDSFNLGSPPFLPHATQSTPCPTGVNVIPQHPQLPQVINTTTGPAHQAAMNVPTILIQPPPAFSDKNIKHFSGFMHEDAAKFLAEFESYLTLSSIEETSPRAIAAFHLQLKGPALIWFNNLTVKDSWTTVKAAFMNEYCSMLNNPSLIAESVAFDNLKLNPTQAIEDFHSVVLDKGRKLNKNNTDMTNKFISGLPPQLAFFVRAGRVSSFREALQSAKIGEAHGYRQLPSVYGQPSTSISAPQSVSQAPSVNAVSDSVQKQLDHITKTLDSLLTKPVSPSPSAIVSQQRPRDSPRSCFKCKGLNHIKSRCNWNGQGEPSPITQCQLCSQWGHGATKCLKFQPTQTASPCQLCQQESHTALQCPQLNQSGLGTMRTSQA